VDVFDALQRLLFSPVDLTYLGLLAAVGTLFALGLLVAWIVAAVMSRYAANWRLIAGASSQIRVCWAWGWCIAASLLVIDAAQLLYGDRLPALWTAMPYLLSSWLALLFSALLMYSVRSATRKVQRLLQRR
jgi:glycerol-3-phosphate acyltransferase PlsY